MPIVELFSFLGDLEIGFRFLLTLEQILHPSYNYFVFLTNFFSINFILFQLFICRKDPVQTDFSFTLQNKVLLPGE
jgi:hypothetical protein